MLETARCAQRDLFFVNLLSGGVYETEAEALAAADAEKSGFPSPLTMSRAFKRYEAALPSSFRSAER